MLMKLEKTKTTYILLIYRILLDQEMITYPEFLSPFLLRNQVFCGILMIASLQKKTNIRRYIPRLIRKIK